MMVYEFNELRKADIVIIGVSRTFKTPLSIYLGLKEWFVGNIPVIFGIELPPIIYKLPPSKVFCLDTNAKTLTRLRQTRKDFLDGHAGEYGDFDYVRSELMYARNIFNTQPKWNIINVTSKPIEEIALEILTIKGRKRRK